MQAIEKFYTTNAVFNLRWIEKQIKKLFFILLNFYPVGIFFLLFFLWLYSGLTIDETVDIFDYLWFIYFDLHLLWDTYTCYN